jgi:Domain of unknown function (DUF4142)
MKGHLAATALSSLLLLQPASAQQGTAPGMTPNRATPEGTSTPLPDPHKDGGRPESHGGTVHAPQVGSAHGAASLAPEIRQAVENVSRSTVTAQQYGNLASKRHASGAVHELGDRMVITNSRVNRALTALNPDLRTSEQMPAQERATFDSLARNADEVQFGVSVAQWVAQTYPQTISALERLGQMPQMKEMAATAVPEMRQQLSDAQKILQTAGAATNGQPLSTGTVGAGGGAKTQSD